MCSASKYTVLPLSIAIASICMAGSVSAGEKPHIEEVIVSAQMRDEPLRQTPIAISAFGSELLESRQVSKLSDLEQYSANMNFGAGDRASRGEITIRGIGDYSRNIGTNARAAVYIDGVLTGRSYSFDQDMANIERVEILRGPQGTLFGANTISGAINIITKKPHDEYSTRLDAQVGNFGQRKLGFVSNVPLTDNIFTSFQYQNTSNDGYINNTTLNRSLQGFDKDSGRFSLRYAGSKLTADFAIDALEEEGKRTIAESLEGTPGFAQAPDIYEVSHNADEFGRRELFGTSLHLDFELDNDAKFISISAYRDNEFEDVSDEDYSSLDVSQAHFDETSEQLTQEFRYVSPKYDKGDYVAGIFFSDQEASTGRSASTDSQAALFDLPANETIVTTGDIQERSASFYIHGNYHFNEKVSLNAGLRFSNEKKDIIYDIDDTTGLFLNLPAPISDDLSENAFTPKIGLNYHIDEDKFLYASISLGHKGGGWNADFLQTLDNFKFKKESALSYEVGIKALEADGKLDINAAVFVTKLTDYQVFQFFTHPVSGQTILLLTNAGEATSQGVEIEVAYDIGYGLYLSTNMAYTNANFDRFEHLDGQSNFTGNSMPFAPPWTMNVALDYSRNLSSSLGLKANLDYNNRDSYFTNPDNTEANTVAGYHRVNASISLEIGESLGVSLWAKNLTDETDIRQKSRSFLGLQRATYLPPRTYGLSLKYQL
ncbi:MAG: hypothetical protein COA42_20955 [Alteromonadaceae bacterium]|nr:MAG: hypothetical protein COA42_20955 [Alteromonadaceae bacterium]